MNAIRCPQCKSVNRLSAVQCLECGMPFGNLLSSAYVSLPAEQAFSPKQPSMIPQDNETGQKAFFWYRVYLGVLAAIYLLMAVGGAALSYLQPPGENQTPQEMLIMGIFYGVAGAIFFLIFGIALFLPRKSYNWVVGMVMICLGMTSCCFLPFLIPLLISWIKPETKAYFGRS